VDRREENIDWEIEQNRALQPRFIISLIYLMRSIKITWCARQSCPDGMRNQPRGLLRIRHPDSELRQRLCSNNLVDDALEAIGLVVSQGRRRGDAQDRGAIG
jgi:hypothetical protein